MRRFDLSSRCSWTAFVTLAISTASTVFAALAVGAVLFSETALAKPDNSDVREKAKSKDPVEWSYPSVQGTVDKMFWAPGKQKNSWTPSFSFYSNESNLEVTVFVDTLDGQALMTDGSVCVGRFVVATGNRIDENDLSAEGLQVLNPDADCSGGLGPRPS